MLVTSRSQYLALWCTQIGKKKHWILSFRILWRTFQIFRDNKVCAAMAMSHNGHKPQLICSGSTTIAILDHGFNTKFLQPGYMDQQALMPWDTGQGVSTLEPQEDSSNKINKQLKHKIEEVNFIDSQSFKSYINFEQSLPQVINNLFTSKHIQPHVLTRILKL